MLLPDTRRPRFSRASLVHFVVLLVFGCGPGDVGTIKAGRDGAAANLFPTPAGRAFRKAPPPAAPTAFVAARRNRG